MNLEAPLHVVLGAGPAGLAVAAELVRRGDRRVRIVNRSGAAPVPAGVEQFAADVSDATAARAACAGASVVYECLNAPYTQWARFFPALQANAIDAAAAADARLVVLENVYMYGPTGGQPLTEDVPFAATTRKGRVRARMSEDLFAAHRAGKVRVAAGRASDFFGPAVLQSSAGERMFGALLAGKAVQALGNPDLPHTYTYIPDVGRALVTLGEDDRALGTAWHLPGPEAVSTRRFVELAGEAAGLPARTTRVPGIALAALGLVNAEIREVREMLYQFEEPFVVDASRYTSTFGNDATPLAEALRQTVAWYQARTTMNRTRAA